MTPTTKRTVLHFETWTEADSFVKLLQNVRSLRVADYGMDTNTNPYWLAIDELQMPGQYTPVQLVRWKACGRVTL